MIAIHKASGCWIYILSVSDRWKAVQKSLKKTTTIKIRRGTKIVIFWEVEKKKLINIWKGKGIIIFWQVRKKTIKIRKGKKIMIVWKAREKKTIKTQKGKKIIIWKKNEMEIHRKIWKNNESNKVKFKWRKIDSLTFLNRNRDIIKTQHKRKFIKIMEKKLDPSFNTNALVNWIDGIPPWM